MAQDRCLWNETGEEKGTQELRNIVLSLFLDLWHFECFRCISSIQFVTADEQVSGSLWGTMGWLFGFGCADPCTPPASLDGVPPLNQFSLALGTLIHLRKTKKGRNGPGVPVHLLMVYLQQWSIRRSALTLHKGMLPPPLKCIGISKTWVLVNLHLNKLCLLFDLLGVWILASAARRSAQPSRS